VTCLKSQLRGSWGCERTARARDGAGTKEGSPDARPARLWCWQALGGRGTHVMTMQSTIWPNCWNASRRVSLLLQGEREPKRDEHEWVSTPFHRKGRSTGEGVQTHVPLCIERRRGRDKQAQQSNPGRRVMQASVSGGRAVGT